MDGKITLCGDKTMSSSINDYRKLIEQPWGKMFYDTLFRQLALPEDHSLNILDFGAGFCVTASHYVPFHHVIAIEPSKEMLALEMKTCNLEEYKNIAFFNHLIFNHVL